MKSNMKSKQLFRDSGKLDLKKVYEIISSLLFKMKTGVFSGNHELKTLRHLFKKIRPNRLLLTYFFYDQEHIPDDNHSEQF